MGNLAELNDHLRENLLLMVAATVDEYDAPPDGWLQLVEFWEDWINDGHYEARDKGVAY